MLLDIYDKLKATVARLPRRVTLLILLGAALLATALWFGLDSLVTASLSTRWQLIAFAGIAIFLLALGLGGLAFFFRRQPRLFNNSLVPGLMLGLAILPSFIIAVTFALVAHTIIRPGQSLSAEFLIQPEVSLWQPWVFYWQVLVLTFAVWIASASSPPTDGHTPTPIWKRIGSWLRFYLPTGKSLVISVLGGLALWLVFTFIQSIAASISKPWLDLGNMATAATPFPLFVILALVSLTLAPWAEEVFFRGLLLDHWQKQTAPLLANTGVAAIFACLPMRPLLWLPAFLLGIGLGLVRQRSGLPAAILAHILFNGLMLLLSPLLVI
ncbi:MAG: CPBP family intramembrane glutamic endopeptidase [Anaerolineaceae bacterium]